MTRRVGVLAALCFAVLLSFGAVAAAADERPAIEYYYENYCDSCQPEKEFMEQFPLLTGRQMADYRFEGFNVAREPGRRLFAEACDRLGVPEAERLVPFVVVDGVYYAGATKIRSAMPADFTGQADDLTSRVHYLYVTACESCARAKAALDALPDSVQVTRGAYEFASPVEVIAIDIGSDLGTAQALFDRFNVPDNKRTAPIVFLRDSYLSGADAIERGLLLRLQRGEAVGAAGAVSRQADLSALSWAGTLAAGLIGGLNPCALSMLLFFVTVLVSSGRGVVRYAVLYLISKLAVYLLIGLAFYSLFTALDLAWLPLLLKLLLTAVCAVLIVLNVSDALAARRPAGGTIRNQLPRGARRFLHQRIQSMLSRGGWQLHVSVVLLGALVASVEFLCSGQVYLATLLTAIDQGVRPAAMGMMLVLYCLAFLLPSALLTALAARGTTVNALSRLLADRMPLVKWATAMLFAAVMLVMWL